MASKTEITCNCGCGRKKMVRTADVKRGWGLFYSKSCKAKEQEKRTGQYKDHLQCKNKNSKKDFEKSNNDYYNDTTHIFSSEGLGQE